MSDKFIEFEVMLPADLAADLERVARATGVPAESLISLWVAGELTRRRLDDDATNI